MASVPRRTKPKIKPPRKHGPDTSMDDTWNSLARAIREIHNHNASNLSFEENYRYAYNLVLYKQGDKLYKGVNALIAENIDKLAEQEVKPAFPTNISSDPAHVSQEAERLLKAVRGVWDDHVSSMSKLRDILKYMDRVYTPTANVPQIWDSGMRLFHDHMIVSPIKEHVVNAILSQISIERDGYAINRSSVKSCVDVLLQLQAGNGQSVYKRDLEPAILDASRTYYAAEAESLLQTCDAPEYLKRVEERLASEDDRARHYLSSLTAAPLSRILEETLLTPNLSAVLSMPNSGLDNMIDMDQMHTLSSLFHLFTRERVETGPLMLKKALKESLLRRGKQLNQAVEEDEGARGVAVSDKGKGKARQTNAVQPIDVATKWVSEVLDLNDKFNRIWKNALARDRGVETTMNEAFETFINLNSRSSEYISLYIDENLKKGLKGKTDQEVEVILDKTITIFRYITEKDAFERYYKNHLSKRLLTNRSVSDDAERGMLAKLKIECGFHFTQKLEGMFTDMKVSADTMDAYRRHLASTSAPEVEIAVTIMTANSWPMNHSTAPCIMPPVLAKSAKSFERFYLSRHSGRRLTWQPGLGNADIRVSFKARQHDLNVTTYALVILLLFEELGEDDFLTYEEVKNGTGLPDNELKRQLQSLACAKYRILKKHPPGRDVNADDSFSFNDGFTASIQRIKIGTVSATKVESPEERKETLDRIDEERRHQTDACIVRIMKDRKHMTHTDLVNEAARQLASRFQPQPLAIKKRIENLIEREYLERCEDRKSYNYLA